MQEFDLIVIGAGSGLDVAAHAADKGLKVAIVEKGPLGGTCLNRGCIPSKMLIHCADVAQTIDNAGKFGIHTEGYKVDWKGIIERVSAAVDKDSDAILQAVLANPNNTLFNMEGKFVGSKEVQVGDEVITAPKIVIAAGTRPRIPEISGIDEVEFMTSKEALRRTEQPEHLVILGGGYISCELAHFYGALGTKVTILQRNQRLLPGEDHELADIFTEQYKQRFDVFTGHTVTRVENSGNGISVHAENKEGKELKVLGDALLVALGRVSNADRLEVAKGGVAVNEHGYIVTDDYMRTNVEGIWAFGDIAGKYFFKHSANQEARYVGYNMFNEESPVAVDNSAMPHAVFGSPQIAGVGATEEELKAAGKEYLVGRYQFKDTGMGAALLDEHGLVKVLASADGEILGCHIVGPEASTLIHEVVLAMKAKLKVEQISDMIHVHPALSEVVERAFGDVDV